MRRRGSRTRALVRSGACALGALLVLGATAAPAWAVAPDPPTGATATAGPGQISVAFDPPANDGGSTITSYTATCTSSDGGAPGSSSDVASPITVGALIERQDLHVHRRRDERRRDQWRVGGVERGDPRDRARPAGRADGDRGRRPDQRRVQPAREQRWQRDHELRRDVARRRTAATPGSEHRRVPRRSSSPGSPTATPTRAPSSRPTATARRIVGRVDTRSCRPRCPTRRRQPTVVPGNAQIAVTFTAPAQQRQRRSPATPRRARRATAAHPAALAGTVSPITVTGSRTATPTPAPSPRRTRSARASRRPLRCRVVPATLPSAPAQPTVTRGNAQIVVTFTAPADNGSPITSYTATCTRATAARRNQHRRAARRSRSPASPTQDLHVHGDRDERRRQRAASPASMPGVTGTVPDAPLAADGRRTANLADRGHVHRAASTNGSADQRLHGHVRLERRRRARDHHRRRARRSP